MSGSWLDELQSGDQVFIHARGLTPCVVQRTTATQVIVAADRSEKKFRRRDGGEVGGSTGPWDTRRRLVEYNADNRRRYQEQRDDDKRLSLAHRLTDIRLLRSLTLEQLERMHAIATEAQP